MSTHNSFVVLDNESIASLANEMGVHITPEHFESIDIMKDLELGLKWLSPLQLMR
jgi:hypothetical protein